MKIDWFVAFFDINKAAPFFIVPGKAFHKAGITIFTCMGAADIRISNNLNQYAKKANETGNIYREDIAELKEMHDEQTKLLRKTLKPVENNVSHIAMSRRVRLF